MNNFYNFENTSNVAQSLVHTINFLGKDIVGVEVGIYRAQNLCMLLQSCKNIKKLYGVDNFKPFTDFKREVIHIGEKEQDYNKFVSYHNIKYSGFKNKAKIIEKDSLVAVNDFKDNSLDFVFLDSYMNKNECKLDLESWYKKVKIGGIFAGHDFELNIIQESVIDFRINNNITTTLSFFDKVWCWKKEQ